MRKVIGSAVLFVAGLLGLLGTCSAAEFGGSVLWQNGSQSTAPFGAYLSIVPVGDLVVAVGNVGISDSSPLDAFIRAMDSSTGATVWEDRVNAGSFDRFQQVTSDGDRIFAGGWLQRPTTGFDFFVRAYEARTGRFLWENIVDGSHRADFSEALVAAGGRVYAAGQIRTAASNNSVDFYVRAMDGKTGAVLWTDQVALRSNQVALTLAVQGNTLVAAGTDLSNSTLTLMVRAYDARTGDLQWNRRVLDSENIEVRNAALTVRGNRVFVGGSAFAPSGDLAFMVRSFDLETGADVWDATIPLGGFEETAFDLAADGQRLFAVGEAGPGSIANGDAVIFAFDASSGGLLWSDQLDRAGGDDFYHAVAVAGDQVIVCGAVTNAAGDYDLFVRSYDASSGAVRWQDQLDVGDADIANDCKVSGDRVFVAGGGGNFGGSGNAIVRAYRIR